MWWENIAIASLCRFPSADNGHCHDYQGITQFSVFVKALSLLLLLIKIHKTSKTADIGAVWVHTL